MRLVILGAPGAGKGTQAEKISDRLGIPHVSTGDILRSEIKKGSKYGLEAKEYVESGRLVPDRLVMDIMEDFILSDAAEKGFLLDGFPRNMAQAEDFHKMLEKTGMVLDRVINIRVDHEEIIRRLGRRRICSSCRNISIDETKTEEICSSCGGRLERRSDDREEVVRKRLEVYDRETLPLVEYYRDRGILVEVDGSGTPEEVTERIMKRL